MAKALPGSPVTPRRKAAVLPPAAGRGLPAAPPPPLDAAAWLLLYRSDPLQRVQWVKEGLPAPWVESIARAMDVPKERLFAALGLPRATIERKARDQRLLSVDESSRVLGLARLVGQVEAMLQESGRPAGFDAAAWLAGWLEQPLAALAGQRPASLMDTPEGQTLVSGLLSRLQTGAYA